MDFSYSAKDIELIDEIKRQGQLVRKHARFWEDKEQEEIPPEQLPEAEDNPDYLMKLAGRTEEDSPLGVVTMIISIFNSWGDTLNMRIGRGALGNAALASAGTPEQKERFGSMRLAMSITEPGCGSDSKAIQTTAKLDGDEWVINGDKIFVTTGVRADGVVVWATVDKSAGRAGIKSFVVPKGTPGFEMVRKEKKLGIRADDTAALRFDNCRIPRDHMLGTEEGVPKAGSGGFKGVMKTFNMTRPAVGAGGIGKAQAAFDHVSEILKEEGVEVDWTKGRANRTATEQTLIETEADLEAATLSVYRAAWLNHMRQ
ncbi:MAG: acyl-CoA dehydrogenase family protein, partial [Alphaproteobacteria bacterium]